MNRDEIYDKLTDEQREALEKEAESEEFQKFLDQIDAKQAELDNHPWMLAKRTLDEEFELTISYEKNGVPVGICLHEGKTMPIIESILMDENPGALITNDLEIIKITPETTQVILAEDARQNAVFCRDAETKDYLIHEYNRKQ